MAQMLLVNPRKRRRKAAKKVRRVKARRRRTRAAPVARRRRRRNPIARRVHRARRRRRNPIGLNLNSVKNQVMDAAYGAGGAVVLDVALGYLPVPDSMKSGVAAPIFKGAAAIALGMVASKVVSSSIAAKMTNGALTVMLHGILRETVGKALPNVQMGGWGDYGFETDSLGYYGSGENPALDEYMPDLSSGVGEYLGDYDNVIY